MPRWIASLSLAALACACGSEPAVPLADCEEDPVVPLLSIANDESARFVGRADDAWVFEVKTYPGAVADNVEQGFWPASIRTQVVAVDGCGAEPRIVADGMVGVAAPTQPGLPWLARLGGDGPTSGLYRLDPSGAAPPERIASDPSGDFLWVENGVLAIDGAVEDPSTLVRIEFLADRRLQKTALREGVESLGSSMEPSLVYTRVAFLSSDRELFVLDLATGDERFVREETMSVFSFDPESRGLVITGAADRLMRAIETDGIREIELNPDGDSTSLMVGPDYVGIAGYAGAEIVESQIVWLPEIREFRGSGQWLPRGGSLDGSIRMLQGPDGLHRLDADADEPVRLRARAGFATVIGDRIWLAEDVAPSQLRLVRMELDGGGAEDLLGHDVAGVRQLDGDRWLYTAVLDERGLGDLEAVDLATGEREPLLDSVTKVVFASTATKFVDDHPNDALVQRVTPHEREGNGIWLVHRDRLFR